MKNFSTLIVMLMSSFLLISCDSKIKEPLTLGMCPWPGYEPIMLASKLNMFETPIKIIRYSSPHEAYKAFKNGAVELVALTTDELLKFSDSGQIPKIFLITDISKGADALVVRPEIEKIDDLKGKTIGLESSVLAKYMLQRILDHSAGLTRSDVSIKSIEIVKQKDAYVNNMADAFITFEPAKSALIKEGAKVLFDSSMIPNEVVDAVAVHNEVFEKRKEDIKIFQKGWYKAIAYIKSHPDEAYAIMGEFENVSAASFKESLKGLEYGTAELNENMIREKGIVEPLKKLQTIMLENGFIANDTLDVGLMVGPI